MAENSIQQNIVSVRHIFIIGAKSIGQYGGYETFVDKLTEQHQNEPGIKYHIACKANGDGFMDESMLGYIEVLKKDKTGKAKEFTYHNAHVVKIMCPDIGPAVAIYYDCAALSYSINYCKENGIKDGVFYILACRIGPFLHHFKKQIYRLDGDFDLYINPDGHEWKRAKWSGIIKWYWKWSEKKMVETSDLVVCDSVNIEKYIHSEYEVDNTVYIAYGADIVSSGLSDDDNRFVSWLEEKGLEIEEYYLVVGRFIPENNYETMIKEFMISKSKKNFAIITNMNAKLKEQLEKRLHFSSDSRIKFVGTVYDRELLKKIRENAYGYFHGHEVGGTNPSLLEALGATKLNLLLDVEFNKEVAQEAALYWNKTQGNLAGLIDNVDIMDSMQRDEYGFKAKKRIESKYSWKFIGNEYKKLWNKKGV